MVVKPAIGRLIRHPLTMQFLPQDGCSVPDNRYWRRRLLAGDVVLSSAETQDLNLSWKVDDLENDVDITMKKKKK